MGTSHPGASPRLGVDFRPVRKQLQQRRELVDWIGAKARSAPGGLLLPTKKGWERIILAPELIGMEATGNGQWWW